METDQIAEWIARAQQRESAAFDKLIEAYADRLYGYFYRMTGSRHDSEDLLQEVFLRLVRMIGDYQHEGRFDAWLFRIATNLVRDRVRRLQHARKAGFGASADATDFADAGGALLHRQNAESDPVIRLERSEQVDQLQLVIGRLPDAEREVICLRHFSQLSFREIATMMQTPLGTALARAHRGLNRLREMMEESDG